MAKEENVPNSEQDPSKERRLDQELLKKGLRCDLDQYEMLLSCSKKKDITDWNQYREENPDKEILLEGADLSEANLQGADLRQAKLQGANLTAAKLQDARLGGANLQDAELLAANLQDARLGGANLQDANLQEANLKGAEFTTVKLQGADFSRTIVDGKTLVWKCEINENTKFEGVGLGNIRIYPNEKQLLEYNIRRMNWQEWYKWKDWFGERPEKERNKLIQFFLKRTIGGFWSISDYGRSTGRIVATFFILAFAFAAIYSNCAFWCSPGIVSNLIVEPHSPIWHYFLLILLRPIYFSVVTMTTLGFGDMYANANSIWGHILLTVQVILGYVLLGALVTRFAVLFTAGGPAGKFTEKTISEKNSKQQG